ncbi:hypothetical protein LCGC14_2901120, partial [marine sediment metagenome]
ATSDVVIYMDAIGYDWDSGYLLGDNYNWNYYPATYDFENQNVTLSGNYYGTYSFEDDAVGATGTGIGFVDGLYGTPTSIIESSLGGHNKILRVTADAGWEGVYNQFDSAQTNGTVEFWVRLPQNNLRVRFGFGDGVSIFAGNRIVLEFYSDSNIHYVDASNLLIDSGISYSVNTWHHLRIDFNVTRSWSLYFDDLLIFSGIGYPTAASDLSYFHFAPVAGGTIYVDAVGYSWDTAYNQIEDTWNYKNDYKSWNKNPYNLTNLFQDNWDYYGVLGGTYSIEGEYGNHKKYLELYDDSDTDYYRGTDSFDYSTEAEVHYGTYDFRTDTDGVIPSGWTDASGAGTSAYVISDRDINPSNSCDIIEAVVPVTGKIYSIVTNLKNASTGIV